MSEIQIKYSYNDWSWNIFHFIFILWFLCYSCFCLLLLFVCIFKLSSIPIFHIVEIFLLLLQVKNMNHHAVIFFVFCLAMVLILVEIHFLSCSIIHKIWWETFMKLIFIKIVCFRNKNKERKKGKFFRKRKQLKENRILRLFLSANSMGNKNI